MKKKMGKLTRLEKRAIKGGDKSIIYEKLGMTSEKDINMYKGKYGVTDEALEDAEALKQELSDKSRLGTKKTKSRYHRKKEHLNKEHFVNMVDSYNEEQARLAELDEDELRAELQEKAQMKAYFRQDDDDEGSRFYPIIIKASQSGVLETILAQTEKIIKGQY